MPQTVSFSCGDVIPGCAAVFETTSEDELLGQIGAHAATDHNITAIDPETLDKVKAAIRTS